MSEQKNSLIIKIPVTYILSENQRLGGGRNKRLSAKAIDYKRELSGALNPLGCEDFYDIYPWLQGNDALDLVYHFVMTSNFWKRDVDNCIKMAQDSVFEWLELNDALIVNTNATKFYAPSLPNELIVVQITPSIVDFGVYETKFKEDIDKHESKS